MKKKKRGGDKLSEENYWRGRDRKGKELKIKERR